MSKQSTHQALIIGGDRHGEWFALLVGAQAWVDIRTGDTYRIASMRWGVTDPGPDGLPVVTERYKLLLAIHPKVAENPASWPIVQEAVSQLAMTELMRTRAEKLPVEADKVPDSPAPLFGPDGGPS